jgi:cytochrome c
MRTAIFGAVLAGGVVVVAAWPQAGTATAGKELFERRCGGCHAFDHDKEGPRLGGVYGRAAASGTSFSYSEALKSSRLTWDDETLDRWLTDSEKLVPNTEMPVRVPSAAERAAIIAYVKSQK